MPVFLSVDLFFPCMYLSFSFFDEQIDRQENMCCFLQNQYCWHHTSSVKRNRPLFLMQRMITQFDDVSVNFFIYINACNTIQSIVDYFPVEIDRRWFTTDRFTDDDLVLELENIFHSLPITIDNMNPNIIRRRRCILEQYIQVNILLPIDTNNIHCSLLFIFVENHYRRTSQLFAWYSGIFCLQFWSE
jgi:hypothetical protein